MIAYKLQRREKVRVEYSDTASGIVRNCTDAKGNAMLVMHKLLSDADLEPGDVITVDVRVLVERNLIKNDKNNGTN